MHQPAKNISVGAHVHQHFKLSLSEFVVLCIKNPHQIKPMVNAVLERNVFKGICSIDFISFLGIFQERSSF